MHSRLIDSSKFEEIFHVEFVLAQTSSNQDHKLTFLRPFHTLQTALFESTGSDKLCYPRVVIDEMCC